MVRGESLTCCSYRYGTHSRIDDDTGYSSTLVEISPSRPAKTLTGGTEMDCFDVAVHTRRLEHENSLDLVYLGAELAIDAEGLLGCRCSKTIVGEVEFRKVQAATTASCPGQSG